ncbi:hypothetical protein [Anatilimnocola floriformis]|uniref:hypothetical protein n=1 Tax=Anatilimnocola floriformis TaxID=2948575 RepID=UPI0020C1DC0D|nr:hypothetical protein [Anatilimnocola floriformis]
MTTMISTKTMTSESPGEISYDLVMEAEMPFIEATFRLPDGPWQVLIFARSEVAEPEIVSGKWDSGVQGYFVRFPENQPLNAEIAEAILTSATGVESWRVVRGPDSMKLR